MITFILSIVLSNMSCEDVIELDLNSTEPRIVIEGLVPYLPEPVTVIISKTGDYFDPGIYPGVPNAIVEVSDDVGNSAILQEIKPGLYQTDSIKGYPGRTYTLKVEVEGETYTATSKMPRPIVIQNLTYKFHPAGGFREEDEYTLFCHFQDRHGIDDYCRILVEADGADIDNYFLYDGEWSDGNRIEYPIDGIDPGLSLKVSLICYDKQVFDYFLTLSGVVIYNDYEETIWTPANPNSNLSNNALGYFAAYTVHSKTILIPLVD